jgi:hypothetical protein
VFLEGRSVCLATQDDQAAVLGKHVGTACTAWATSLKPGAAMVGIRLPTRSRRMNAKLAANVSSEDPFVLFVSCQMTG